MLVKNLLHPNEFGEIGIDGALVINADEEIFEMNNGCICCTVRGDLIRILSNLQKRRHKFDYVMIETDGLADPAPVAQTFFVDPDMQEWWSLDGIVTVIDAKHVNLHWDTNDEVKEQIAFADVLLINKIDLVSSEDLAILERRIRSINIMAKIHFTRKSELPINTVLNIGAFDLQRILDIKPQFLEPEVPFEWSGIFELDQGEYTVKLDTGPDPSIDLVLLPIDDTSEESLFKAQEDAVLQFSNIIFQVIANNENIFPGHSLFEIQAKTPTLSPLRIENSGLYALFTQHLPEEYKLCVLKNHQIVNPILTKFYNPKHEHDSEISSVSIEFLGDLDSKRLNTWMAKIMREKGADIFRMKGILSIKGQPNRFVFHGVHMLFDGIPDQPWGGRPRVNQMVFVGKNLSHTELTDGLRGCMA